MHGRLKVKTSAQEQEEKRKERERKLKIYRAGFEVVFSKRQIGERDGEILQITEQLLCGNPDIYTLWNIRREILNDLQESKLKEMFEEDLKGELRVTEAALRSNPKSYGAWHHRMWVLESMQNPPVTQELILCGKLLKADPRNCKCKMMESCTINCTPKYKVMNPCLISPCGFRGYYFLRSFDFEKNSVHCWDYRRWLTLSGTTHGNKDREELEFSLEKLNENFSNYSAWHYRTLFLPRVHPDGDAPCGITSSQHKKELDLVQSAVFTDPGDQSAWFYLRWLLGKSGSSHKPQLRMGVLQHRGESYSAALVLNVPKECREQSVLQAELLIGKEKVKGKWKNSPDLKMSYLWIFVPDECNESISAALERAGEDGPSIVITEDGEEVDKLFLKKVPPKEDGIIEWVCVALMEENGKSLLIPVLEEQLSLCTQLLDLEPDSRWALLTAVQLLRTLKMRQPKSKLKEYDEMVMEYLDKLIDIDPLRCGYYSDLRSDCCLESALHFGNLNSSVIDLSSLGLTTFPSPLASLPIGLISATEIDLSYNSNLTLPLVKTGALAALAHLPRLRSLRISASFHKLNNSFSSLYFLPNLPHLLQFELVPDDDQEIALSKEVTHIIYKIMPSLTSLKPV